MNDEYLKANGYFPLTDAIIKEIGYPERWKCKIEEFQYVKFRRGCAHLYSEKYLDNNSIEEIERKWHEIEKEIDGNVYGLNLNIERIKQIARKFHNDKLVK